MKQRVMIAMALAGEPEPADRRRADHGARRHHPGAGAGPAAHDCSASAAWRMLLITHDLGVVARDGAPRRRDVCRGNGRGGAAASSSSPRPRIPTRTQAVRRAARRRAARQALATIPGSVPPLGRDSAGCRFAERCAHVDAGLPRRCRRLARVLASGQRVRCHLDRAAAAGRVAAAMPRGSAQRRRVRRKSAPLAATSPTCKVHFPIRRGVLQRDGRPRAGGRRRVAGHCRRAARWRWWANRAAARPRSGKAMLQLMRPTAGSVQLDGRN